MTYRCQMRIVSQQWTTWAEIFFRKLRDIWFSEIFSRTDIQIDTQTRPSQYLAVDEVILHVSCMNHAVKVTISVDQHMNASASLAVN